MDMCVRVRRGLVVAGLLLGVVLFGVASWRGVAAPRRHGAIAGSIVVEGNRRVEADTIRSYFKVGARRASRRRQDRRRAQGALRLGPVPGHPHFPIGRPADRDRGGGPGHRSRSPSRATTRSRTSSSSRKSSRRRAARCRAPTVQADVQRIIEVYQRNGRFDVTVVPKIIERPNNRVDLVFEIKEGEKTGVKSIIFVGNHAYSDYRLKEVIKTVDVELPELSADHRRLRSRPHRGRPRSDPALLSRATAMPTCRSSRRPANTIRRRRASSSPSRSRRGRSTISAPSTFNPISAPSIPQSLRYVAADAAGRRLQRRGGREDGRGPHRRNHQARLSVRHGAAARRPQPAEPHDQRRLRRR